MNNYFDISIAYRIYPGISKVPPIFSDDKLKLSELCLCSFKQSLGNMKFKLFAMLDNCPDSYVDLFKKYFNSEELEIIRYDGIGNAGTFEQQMKILQNQDYSEFIYFAEDDYFYLDNALKLSYEFLKNHENADFVSPYFHPDYDRMKIHKQFPGKIVDYNSRKWKTVASTTLTFMTTKSKLKQTERIFRTYLQNNYDASIWFTITKHKVKNPFNILKYFVNGILWSKILLKSWMFSKMEIFRNGRMNLFVPVKTLSTHMDDKCLATGIDWSENFQRTIEKLFK